MVTLKKMTASFIVLTELLLGRKKVVIVLNYFYAIPSQ
jgi:hypothetical protein